jgi:hypothetical protein
MNGCWRHLPSTLLIGEKKQQVHFVFSQPVGYLLCPDE